MEVQLLSSTLELYHENITNEQLNDALRSLNEANGCTLQVYYWDQYNIAVPLTLEVDIPPLGTYEGIDIQESEPVLFVFSLIHYPFKAPDVYTDRLDFPKDKLAHLYIATKGLTPAFCYVRGDRDEWFANKRIQDLIVRIRNWLRDAANGSLTLDGNQFEPLRLEGYTGVIIYDYDLIARIVEENKSLLPDGQTAVGLFESTSDGGFRLVKILTFDNVKEVVEDFTRDKAKSDTDPNRKHYRLGYFLWSKESDNFEPYNISYPSNWGEFKEFCSAYKISGEKFEELYVSIDDSNYVTFPLIIAVKRPKTVIGFSSNIEFVNFRFSIDSKEIVDEKFAETALVKLSSHNQPLTTIKAKAISGTFNDHRFSASLFGCGALGSKITMHLARSGMTNLTLIDPDSISPHNMVRHALLPEYEGQNKASALASVIRRLFPTEELQISHSPYSNLPFLVGSPFFDEVDWCFDFTASDSFFSKLILTKVLDKTQVVSAHISNFGNMGIFLHEGEDRNPRIDDLKINLYSQYNVIPEVSFWLKSEQAAINNTNLIVSVGVGCNSETTILSDEKVSLHAAVFSGAIKKEANYRTLKNGRILLSMIQDEENFTAKTMQFDVLPLDIYSAINDSSWSIRFKHGIISRIKQEMQQAGKNETGGVFIGVANHKTKTVHITGLLEAPPDSEANSVCFFRGHQGLPDQVDAINNSSGGQLGYVGEWHSHPEGPSRPSETDLSSVRKFKKEFDTLLTPLPVFLTIVTQDKILPYVF